MALRSIWAQAAGQKSPLRPFARYSLYIATWIPVAICFHDYVGGYIKVSGPSMYPYLNDNYNESLQQAMCLQVKWMARQHLNRGMIVTLRSALPIRASATKQGLPSSPMLIPRCAPGVRSIRKRYRSSVSLV
jgi:hypothetical protein